MARVVSVNRKDRGRHRFAAAHRCYWLWLSPLSVWEVLILAEKGRVTLDRDPVDRFLAGTALVYDLTLVTADERLLRSQRISTLANTLSP